MKLEVLCPAGTDVHPVLSPNPMDVQCRVQGGLRPAATRDAQGNAQRVVCCAEYTRCSIWRIHKDIVRPGVPSTKRHRDETLSEPHRHTLSNATRDKVVIG